jgi:hypothetical protein
MGGRRRGACRSARPGRGPELGESQLVAGQQTPYDLSGGASRVGGDHDGRRLLLDLVPLDGAVGGVGRADRDDDALGLLQGPVEDVEALVVRPTQCRVVAQYVLREDVFGVADVPGSLADGELVVEGGVYVVLGGPVAGEAFGECVREVVEGLVGGVQLGLQWERWWLVEGGTGGVR